MKLNQSEFLERLSLPAEVHLFETKNFALLKKKTDGACQHGSQAAGCDSELTLIGFHRLIAAGRAVTDGAVTSSSVSHCGKIQKNLSVGEELRQVW